VEYPAQSKVIHSKGDITDDLPLPLLSPSEINFFILTYIPTMMIKLIEVFFKPLNVAQKLAGHLAGQHGLPGIELVA
jgi:hypothetical protein